ncbi:MAG: hypothetical protein ACHQ51_06810 [Elusimicrobiota bacterium]
MKNYLFAAVLAWACVASAPGASRAAETSKIAETKAEYVKKAHAELDELSARIDALEVKARKTGAATDEALKKKISELKARRKTAKKDFAKLKRASGEAWADLKAGVDKGIDDIKKELDEAKKE